MTRMTQSLLWAAIILAAAVVSNLNGLSDSASFAVVTGLSAAAWGSINRGTACKRPLA